MPGAVTNPPFGVQDPSNVRALSAISPNTRARGSNGSIATLADALLELDGNSFRNPPRRPRVATPAPPADDAA